MLSKILIVEDELITVLDLKNSLEMMGFEVVSAASSGEEAIKKAMKLKPDLVLMDIMLKGEKDGIEAAIEITATLNIPIIYLTAYSDNRTIEMVKLTKSYGFINKPFNYNELKEIIDNALYKHSNELEQCLI